MKDTRHYYLSVVFAVLCFYFLSDSCNKASVPLTDKCGPSCTCGCAVTGVCDCEKKAKVKPSLCDSSCKCGCQVTGICTCNKTTYKPNFYRLDSNSLMTESAVKVTMKVPFTRGYASTYCGSGVVVYSTEDTFDVLTCAHVIRHGADYRRGTLTIDTHSGKQYSATAWSWGGDRDLALLRVSSPKCGSAVRVAELANSEVYRQGTSVSKAGHTAGGPLRITTGSCIGEEVDHDGYKHQLIRIDSGSGDSGCGVYRDSDCALVGVITGTSNGPRGQSTHIRPLPVVKKFLTCARRRPTATLSVPLLETPVRTTQTWTKTLPDGSKVTWTWIPREDINKVAPRIVKPRPPQAPRLPTRLPSYIPPQAPSRPLFFSYPTFRAPMRSGGC